MDFDPNNPAGETVLPVSVLVSRWEKHRDEMLQQVKLIPWWNFKRKWILRGSAATYQYEIDAVLQLGGATVMDRLINKLVGRASRE